MEDNRREIEIINPVTLLNPTGKSKKAWFHNWIKKAGSDGGEYMMALVEMKNGKVTEVYAEEVRFLSDEELEPKSIAFPGTN